jgi:transcription initiation factor TFIID subunit 8
MLSSRRSQPTPIDFEFALRREGLTARLLRPHLKVPIPASKLQPKFTFEPPKGLVYRPAGPFLGEELSGASDKLARRYIPKKFPSFPSKHTYKSTEVKPERESDPRKIRENAIETARHGEEALRRLVKVGKAGDYRLAKKALKRSPKLKRRHELWESAMADLTPRTPTSQPWSDSDDAERSILVNASKPYGRKEPLPKKTQALGSHSSSR